MFPVLSAYEVPIHSSDVDPFVDHRKRPRLSSTEAHVTNSLGHDQSDSVDFRAALLLSNSPPAMGIPISPLGQPNGHGASEPGFYVSSAGVATYGPYFHDPFGAGPSNWHGRVSPTPHNSMDQDVPVFFPFNLNWA